MAALFWPAQTGLPLLSALIVLPLLAIVPAILTRTPRQALLVGMVGSLLELILACLLLVGFQQETHVVQFAELLPLLPFLSYHVGLDGLNILFVLLTALLTFLVVLYGEIVHEEPPGRYMASLLAFESILMGMFLSLDFLQFWILACLELVPAKIILDRWSTSQDKTRAGLIYRRFMVGGLAMLLLGLLLLGWNHARLVGHWSFDYAELAKAPLSDTWQSIIFVLLFYGFAVRMAQFPFHAWLPVVAQHGTLATACVFLVGLKVGVYALVRFVLPLLPGAVVDWQGFVAALGVGGMFYGAILALLQLDLRRLLAFAAISQTGMLVVGVFCLNREGLSGTLLLSVNFGVAASGLLFVTGLLYRRARTTLLPRLGGLFDLMPLLGLTFLTAALSTMAMPGTPGFDAAHLLLEGTIVAHEWGVAIAVATGNVLAAAFLLWAFQRAFLAERREPLLKPAERRLRPSEAALSAIVCTVLLGVGFYSEPWVRLVERSLAPLSQRFQPLTPKSE